MSVPPPGKSQPRRFGEIPPVTMATDGCEWRQVKDISGNVVATDVLMRGTAATAYRGAPVYTEAVLSYNVGTQTLTDRRKTFPRQRLLRSNRDSGYETAVNGSMELLGLSNAAPMLLDNETLVGVSSALWSANSLSGTVGEPYIDLVIARRPEIAAQ